MSAELLLLRGAAMASSHFLFVVVSSKNGWPTSSPSERFLAAQIVGAKDARELFT
jgi:hypothetical protein